MTFTSTPPPTYNGEGTDGSMASFICVGEGRRAGHDRLRLGQPAGSRGLSGLSERPGRQHHRDRRWARSGAIPRTPGRRSTGRRPATGPACAPRRRWPRTTGSTSSVSITPHRSASSTGRSATKSTEAGRSTTTRRSTTRPRTSRSPSSSQTYAAKIDPTISIGLDVGSPGRLQQLDRQHPAAVGQPGIHRRVPERPQLRASPGQRERLQPLAQHRHRHQQRSLGPRQPVRLGRRAADYESLLTQYLGCRRQVKSSCWRPSSTRFTPTPASRRPAWSTACSWPTRWAPCSRRPTTAPTSGTCAIPIRPAATTRRASTAGARAATTA